MSIRIGRTSATTVTFSSPQEVVISHVDDSIRLGDGTSLTTTTTNGPKVGLDVNIINDEIEIDVINPGTPTIYNVAVATAATEFSQALSAGTKNFLIRTVGNARLQFSFAPGTTATNFITLPKNATYQSPDLDLTSVTIYFRCDSAPETVQILEWS